MHSLNFARAEDFRMQTFAQILSNVRSGIGRHTLDQNLTLVSGANRKARYMFGNELPQKPVLPKFCIDPFMRQVPSN